MCGLNGIYGLGDSRHYASLVAGMNAAIAHRGPDDEGIFIEENLALGHRRLSIIDLSSAGHQPMTHPSGRYTIVYNGELYNYQLLKQELRNVHEWNFTTETDTEVILAAYACWGIDCLNKFNGMYAFAVWDHTRKELFIARDRLGIKPIYYYQDAGFVVFSSEVRGLLSSNLVPRTICSDSLVDYLRYLTVQAPYTILKNVFELLPGHYILINRQHVLNNVPLEQKKYWSLDEPIAFHHGADYREVCMSVKKLFTEAVERRMMSDVPFGAFLSGGIDSSAVVATMSQVAAKKVKTFSIVFSEKEFSEAKYARMVADKYNTEHHEIMLSVRDLVKELPAALQAMDHPCGDGINTYVVSKATKEAGVKMVLSGLGGDELFAGYSTFRRMLTLKEKEWITRLPFIIRKGGAKLLKTLKPGTTSDKMAEFMQLSSMHLSSTYPLVRQVLMDEHIRRLMNNAILPSNRVASMVSELKLDNFNSYFSKVSLAEISAYMQNTLLRDTDQMSMAHALEVRVPFLDYTFVSYVLNVSDKYKGRHSNTPKKLLIDSLGDLIPGEVVNRPKMGFTLPWKYWLKHDLRDFCFEKLSALGKREYFEKKELEKLWHGFLNYDTRISWARIWYLVVLEHWLDQHKING